jgi:hypothetical protein
LGGEEQRDGEGELAIWIVVGAATMLGAPFWYDALKRLAGLRAGRGLPPKAAEDPTSATASARASNSTAMISLNAPAATALPSEPPAN